MATQGFSVRLCWKVQVNCTRVPKNGHRGVLERDWASSDPPRCVSLSPLCLLGEGQIQFPDNSFKHAASALTLLSPAGISVKLVVGLRKDRAGVGWCKFLIAVTNTVVALLRNKGENVPLELCFFPCFSFSLSPLGMFCSFLLVFPCSSLPLALPLPPTGFSVLISPALVWSAIKR